jgi:hypothetical protein
MEANRDGGTVPNPTVRKQASAGSRGSAVSLKPACAGTGGDRRYWAIVSM